MPIDNLMGIATLALRRIHEREWPAGDHFKAARHAAEMWDIADRALDAIGTETPSGGGWREVVGSDATHLDEFGPVRLPDAEHKKIDGVWYRRPTSNGENR